MKCSVFVKWFIPGNTGMCCQGDQGLNTCNEKCGITQSQINQCCSQVNLRKKYGVKYVLPAGHRHTHIGCGMMCPVEPPEKRNLVMQPMIPILRQVICNSDDKEGPAKGNP